MQTPLWLNNSTWLRPGPSQHLGAEYAQRWVVLKFESLATRHQLHALLSLDMEMESKYSGSNLNLSSESMTAVDPNSAQTTPRIGGYGQRRASSTIRKSSSSYNTASRNEGIGSLPKAPKQGWPNLAQYMSKVPEFAAFPRFKDLNTKSLLYYQAQLQSLREEIHAKEHMDEDTNVQRADLMMEDEDSEYFMLIEKMRELLKKYNEALLLYSQVSAMPDPEAYNMRSLSTWLQDENGADQEVCDKHGQVSTWGKNTLEMHETSLWVQFKNVVWVLFGCQPPPEEELDLVITHPQVKVDGLTRWIVYNVVPFWWAIKHKRKARSQRDEESRKSGLEKKSTLNLSGREDKKTETLESFSDATALRITSSVSTVVACLLPVIAIAVLSQVNGTRDVLLCITGFAVIFATGLMFLTQGTSSRTETFAATAAFSAVMVVFISQPVIIQTPAGTPPANVTM